MERKDFKTFLPMIMGIFAGIASYAITGGIRARDPFGVLVLVVFIYLHKFILPKLNIDVEGKDWLALAFFTLSTWYITWTLLLNQY